MMVDLKVGLMVIQLVGVMVEWTAALLAQMMVDLQVEQLEKNLADWTVEIKEFLLVELKVDQKAYWMEVIMVAYLVVGLVDSQVARMVNEQVEQLVDSQVGQMASQMVVYLAVLKEPLLGSNKVGKMVDRKDSWLVVERKAARLAVQLADSKADQTVD